LLDIEANTRIGHLLIIELLRRVVSQGVCLVDRICIGICIVTQLLSLGCKVQNRALTSAVLLALTHLRRVLRLLLP